MFNWILNLLFPPSPLVSELTAMTSEEFSARAIRNLGGAGKDIISLFEYRTPLVKEAVWQLKYAGNKKIATLLAELLYDELLAFLEEYAEMTNFSDPLLVPIPISAKRRRERGFNQCELLADALEELDAENNVTVRKTALTKTKDTPSQTHTDTRKKRLENLKDCFRADTELVAGRNIILIDDVATTGATLQEARKTLLSAGARKVIAFTIAH